MTKTIYSLAIALVLGTTLALAEPGGEGNNTGCNGQGNPNSPCEGNGGGGNGGNGGNGGGGGSSDASANSESTAVGVGVGIGTGGNVVNNVVLTAPPASTSSDTINAVGTGGEGGSSYASGGSGGSASSGSYSSGGDSESTVGNVTSHSGDSTAVAGGGKSSVGDTHTGDVKVDASDNSSYSYSYEEKEAASSAAAVYAQVCQTGGSAQGVLAGMSVVNSDMLCDHLKMASVYQNLYEWEMTYGEVVCHDKAIEEPQRTIGRYTDTNTCFPKYAYRYYDLYHEHMTDAEQLMDATEEMGIMDKAAGYLIRPLSLIGALIWLI